MHHYEWRTYVKKMVSQLCLVFESPPQETHRTLLCTLAMADVFLPKLNHFDTICKELSELKIFFLDSEAQCALPADNESIELANTEISLVFMIKG